MPKKFWSKLRDLVDQYEVDPSSFHDPIAMKTEWTPAKPGGANFYTHELVVVNPDRLEFRVSILARLFVLLLLIGGILLLILFIREFLYSNDFVWDIRSYAIVFSVFGLFFVSGSLFLWMRPTVFDKKMGYFWKGRKRIKPMDGSEDPEDISSLKDIHAIQLISEFCSGDSEDNNVGSFTSYELNIVFHDGHRINIVDNSEKAQIRKDAKTLSIFLDKPVWDGILE